tara:strand:+ start:301 stop:489 length:189 start_codon:yes stop_codon:yes gene_type:complete
MKEIYTELLDVALDRVYSNPGCYGAADHFGALVSHAHQAGMPKDFLDSYINRANEICGGHDK